MRKPSAVIIVLTLLILSVLLIVPKALLNSQATARGVHQEQSLSERVPMRLRTDDHSRHLIPLGDAHDLPSVYTGPASRQQLEDRSADPLSLAAGDVDEDGVSDLITGYAAEDANLLVISRGNVDAIYPNTPQAQERKDRGEFTDAPFLAESYVVEVPERPDIIGTGDFDADGHRDVVIATLGSQRLYWLAGNGHDGLGFPQAIELNGRITAMTVGEMNRPDGQEDVVVGTDGPAGSRLLIYENAEGAFRGQPEELMLQHPATSLALGQLDDGYEMDLAIAAGSDLLIVHGRDRRTSLDEEASSQVEPADVDVQSMPFEIIGLTIGEFGGGHRSNLALLSSDQILHVFRARSDGPQEQLAEVATGIDTHPVRCDSAMQNASCVGAAPLLRARVSLSGKDDLVVMDHRGRQVKILTAEPVKHNGTGIAVPPVLRIAASLDINGDPVAVLPMRLNIDALNDLVILKKGAEVPIAVASTAPFRTFTVNSSADQTDINPGDGKCETAANNGVCTLRAALAEVNAGPGGDQINFSVKTVTAVGTFSVGKTVTIDGGASRVEINRGLSATASSTGNHVLRSLVINNLNGGAAIDIEGQTGNNFVEGCFIGTDATGSNTAFGTSTSWNGIQLGGSFGNPPNNTVGGPVAAARNVVNSPGSGFGITISAQSSGNKLEGNYIGTDASGVRALGNGNTGVASLGSNTTIGGTAVGAGNVISCASTSLCTNVSLGGSGVLLQGNLIGTDAGGTTALNNGRSLGVQTLSSSGLTIGGTTPAARNVISGNAFSSGYGIQVNTSPILIQGNYIGTDRSGAAAIGNSVGVSLGSTASTVGGTASGARNVISGNSGNAITAGSTSIIQGNFIGTDAGGTNDLGNGSGIFVGGDNSQVGGTSSNAANIIAFTKANSGGTQGSGVRVFSGNGNAVLRNSMFGNAKQAILSDANSADKAPVLSGSTGTLTGARANTAFTIQFFSNDSCGASGTQQAKNFISEVISTTNASGNSTFSLPAGQNITATATAAGTNTSSVSNCVAGTATTSPTPTPSPTPQISLTPTQLNFNATVGDTTGPTPQTVTLRNSGGTTMTWQSAVATVAGSGNWLSVNPPSGSLAGNQSVTLTVSAAPGDLFSDIYTGTITISSPNAGNSPQKVNVTFTLDCPAGRPDLNVDAGSCTSTLTGAPSGGTNVSDLGLRENGLRGLVTYLLRAKKKADLVMRVFDQNDNRVGTSPTKSITRPPSDPAPLPSNDVFFVPNEIASKQCHVLGGDDGTCGSSISLFADSKSLYMQALMIDPDTGTVLVRSPKVLYSIVPFKIDVGTPAGGYTPIDPSYALTAGSSATDIQLSIRVTSGLEDVNHSGALPEVVFGEKSRSSASNCTRPDDRYVRGPILIGNYLDDGSTPRPIFAFEHEDVWNDNKVPDDVDILEYKIKMVLSDGVSAVSEPAYVPIDRIKIVSPSIPKPDEVLTPGITQDFSYTLQYNINRADTEIRARIQTITNVAALPIFKSLAIKQIGDTGCQEFHFSEPLPDDVKIVNLDFLLIPPSGGSPVTRRVSYLKFSNPIQLPPGVGPAASFFGFDLQTTKNLFARALKAGRQIKNIQDLIALANSHRPALDPRSRGSSPASDPDYIPINKNWTFEPPIPADGSFEADLTFHYEAADLPDDPNFSETDLKVISVDLQTGSIRSYSTTLDKANKTARAHVDSLAAVYTLAVIGPFSQSTLNFPVFQTATSVSTQLSLANLGTTSAALNSRALDPAGTSYSGSGVTNPASQTLAAGQQIARDAPSLFGLTATSRDGWIQTRSSTTGVIGYHLVGGGNKLDGLDIPLARSTFVVLPDVEYNSAYTTEAHAANASNFPANLSAELHSPDGSLMGTYEASLDPKGELIKELSQMFPLTAKPFTGYITIRSDQQLAAAEILASNSELAALNGQPAVSSATGATKLYAARLVSDGSTLTTRLNLVNPTSSTANITLRANNKNGTSLGSPVNVMLAPGQQYQRDVKQVFGFASGVLTEGSLVVDSSIPGVLGDVVYSDPNGAKPFRTALPLETSLTNWAAFPQVDNGSGRFTEVDIANPNAQPISVDLMVFRSNGSQTGVKTLQIPAGGSVADQLSNLVPASGGQTGGYFVVSAANPISASATFGTSTKTMLASIPATRPSGTFTIPTARKAAFDFDGDGKSDVAVFRPSAGNWFVNRSRDGFYGQNFGLATDKLAPADYDGDGKADIAVYRPSSGVFFIYRSSDGGDGSAYWGLPEDIPCPADFDGDGKDDIAIYRPSTNQFWIRRSASGNSPLVVQYGTSGDKPVVGDYDGDGKADYAIYRPSNGIWFMHLSSTNTDTAVQFGIPTDKAVPGDYDGDGKTDVAVYRTQTGVWFTVNSSGGFTSYQFGFPADTPAPADYDGDGKIDFAIFRPGENNFWINGTRAGVTVIGWGTNGDMPIENAYVR